MYPKYFFHRIKFYLYIISNHKKFKYFIVQEYALITNNGLCKHANGNYLSYCKLFHMISIAECEAFCTNHTSCVAYHYSTSIGCYLLPSDRTCPSSFRNEEGSFTAETINDLMAHPASGFVCYAKIPG